MAVAEQNKLKQTISIKNSENVRAFKQIDKIEKEKSTLTLELQSAMVAVQHARTELAEKEHECRQLYRSLCDEENKCIQTKKKVDGVLNEKDRLGAVIVKKNEDIDSLNSKQHLMRQALDRSKKCQTFFSHIFFFILFVTENPSIIHF